MTECEAKLALAVIVAVFVFSCLAVLACIKVAGDCSREEESQNGDT